MKPLPVVLGAPPDIFAWGSATPASASAPTPSLGESGAAGAAAPTRLGVGARMPAYAFHAEASTAIWCSAGAFRGEAPAAQ